MPVSAYNPNTSTRVATRNADGDVVRYTYDVFGNKTTMTTYRNESLGPASGDVTTWRYDEASNCMTNKVYADGKGPKYGYTQDGKLAQRIWARGIVTDYSYDGWGSLTNTVYSDGTPTVTLLYDAMGRQTNAVDAAGVTMFRYDDFGSLINETVIGPAGENTIVRYWDAYGRTAGYTLNNVRQTTIGYDSATGRIATMLANGSNVPFAWSYLPGSDLKSSLAYPNGLTASWTYDANGQLLQVRNATPTDVISQYDYTYDAAGRRISCGKSGSAFTFNDTLSYGSNNRSELTNAVAAVDSAYRYAYDFDEIGNRETSVERGTNSVYTANNLNQYTAVDDFSPQFDDDGNQTLVKTATGIWSVTYNGENRPIYWTNGDTVITMSYDRMGRRNTKNGLSFVYNGYLQIANFGHSASIVESQVFIWNPMEPVATRPLTWSISTTQLVNSSSFYYVYDGNKNVSEVIKMDGDIAAHYEYAPFGSVVAQCGVFAPLNPWRFSCEYADDETAMVYYNYRHYEPAMGRWMSRDPVREFLDLVGAHVWFCLGQNSYSLVHNQPVFFVDALGLTLVWDTKPFPGSCPVELLPDVTYHFRSIDDDQDGIVRLRRETAEDLDVQMRVTAKRLCLYAKEDGKRSLIHEMTFDTKFFEGEYEQHQYYHIEGHEGIWADNEVNYIGIGMYEAWLGHSLDSAVTITALWKLRYLDSPSDGTCYWLAYGHTMFETYYAKLDPCTCEFKDGKDVDVDNYNRWRRRSR